MCARFARLTRIARFARLCRLGHHQANRDKTELAKQLVRDLQNAQGETIEISGENFFGHRLCAFRKKDLGENGILLGIEEPFDVFLISPKNSFHLEVFAHLN